jgi:hypothetical protein
VVNDPARPVGGRTPPITTSGQLPPNGEPANYDLPPGYAALEAAARRFVERCQAGEIRSVRSRAMFESALSQIDDSGGGSAAYIRDPERPDHVERVPLAEGLECPELRPACIKAPVGWRCTRGADHDGPCAAVECGA